MKILLPDRCFQERILKTAKDETKNNIGYEKLSTIVALVQALPIKSGSKGKCKKIF